MRIILGIAFLLILLPATIFASPVDNALSAYKDKEYHKAAYTLLSSAQNLDSLSDINKLKSAIIFLNNAILHKEISVKSRETQVIFLEALLNEQTETESSQYIYLYLGENYIHRKEYNKAQKVLKLFIDSPHKSVNDNYKNLAKLYLAWIELKNGNDQSYKQLLKNIKNKHLILELAAEFIHQNVTNDNNIDKQLISNISKTFIVKQTELNSRTGNYALNLLTRNGALESARAIYNRLPFHSPSYVEEITPIKIINFYESTLPETLVNFYSAYAEKLLKQIINHPKLGDTATFYLSELYIFKNVSSNAHEFSKKVKGLVRLPKSLSAIKLIRSSTHGFLDGKHSRAYQVWEEAVDNDKNDPTLSADAILMCLMVDGNCPTLVQKAQVAAENSRSKRFESLSTSVGRYFLRKDLNEKALRLMEVALDRSAMNSLLANDPILLLNLAEAYRVNKKYSKALQVYFSLGQNFPVMRQIQDAVQGEYLYQQRSTGQSNVF